MMKKNFILILLLSLLTILACGIQVDVAVEKEAVTEASDRLEKAIESDDVDGIMSSLADGHISMAPNAPAMADMSILRSWHETRVENFTFDFSITIDEIEIARDWAIERWNGRSTLTPRSGGDQIHEKLKGIWVWKRQVDGEWKMARSIWNSDLPLPGSN